ncbi:NmrA family NAD(P)-binding protein [Paenarthrobacter sp. PH39-S1]|uniref:SDR family oxidoreductase n=1 Tax=Paenarthrobacter sp. PH39-S1 TaxID=3046204 RepID=UPI0024BBBC3E|nr:NmrA family NAD(P)-binding protein [Paenarthrobacter sp. PH39-S1]MDJ0358064.1 NmrA family NAD(P)-binding protein [Paenarthrobacter sp. PH39-S1]
MVLIAVAGGTGTAGRMVVAEAARRGYGVRSLSRHLPAPDHPSRMEGPEYVVADAASGEGLAEALAGADLLIETLDAKIGAALKILPATSGRLLRAAAAAGVGRAVLLTIANAGNADYGYYKVQAARARQYERAQLPTSVVAATQFHDLVAGIFSSGARYGLVPVIRGVSFQPIATADVARALVDAAVDDAAPAHSTRTIGGPEVLTMRQLVQQWKAATGRKGMTTPLPLPGSLGRFLRQGGNLVPEHAGGTVTFSQWLDSRGA